MSKEYLVKTKPPSERGGSNWLNYYFFSLLMSCFSLVVKDVNQKMKGRRSLSMDQFLSLKSGALSVLKWDSKESVACISGEANRLCSSKNCCFFVILSSYTYSLKKQPLFYLQEFHFKDQGGVRRDGAWIRLFQLFQDVAQFFDFLAVKSPVALSLGLEGCLIMLLSF